MRAVDEAAIWPADDVTGAHRSLTEAALRAAERELVARLRRFRLDASDTLSSEADDLLVHLAKLDFRIRRYGDQAALDHNP